MRLQHGSVRIPQVFRWLSYFLLILQYSPQLVGSAFVGNIQVLQVQPTRDEAGHDDDRVLGHKARLSEVTARPPAHGSCGSLGELEQTMGHELNALQCTRGLNGCLQCSQAKNGKQRRGHGAVKIEA